MRTLPSTTKSQNHLQCAAAGSDLYVEYGTHNRDGSVRMEARQHIRTALNEEIDQIMDELLARL